MNLPSATGVIYRKKRGLSLHDTRIFQKCITFLLLRGQVVFEFEKKGLFPHQTVKH